jgi:hypothetical protein
VLSAATLPIEMIVAQWWSVVVVVMVMHHLHSAPNERGQCADWRHVTMDRRATVTATTCMW